MSALEAIARRVLHVPVAAVRPYVLLKGMLLLLAFDVWLTRISHGGRYGAGGFNVAHFAWLDAIQPSVSPALYIAVCTLTGFACFALALAPRPPRWLIALAFLLHTWSWAMSMLDSYQHHYLLSLVLLALIFFPRLGAEQALLPPEPKRAPPPAKKSKKKRAAPAAAKASPLVSLRAPTTAAWAYVALAWSIAIVYAYTAFSKTSEGWLTGAAMQSVVHLPEGGRVPAGAFDPVGPIRWLAWIVGIEGERFWWLLGHSVVLVQIVCAAGYLLAPFRDAARSKLLAGFSWIALLTALSFHLGAEHMQLQIGWFSWYMVLTALVMLLPAEALALLMRCALPLARRPFSAELLAARVGVGLFVLIAGLIAYGEGYGDLEPEGVRRFAETFLDPAVLVGLGALLLLGTPARILIHALDRSATSHAALISVALGAIALFVACSGIDLPGVGAAGLIAAVAVGAGTIGLLVLRGHARAIHPYGVGAVLGAAAFFLVVWQSDVRFDFWRNVGGDHRRRGEVATAYEAYVKANCYAPPGADRREREEEMRRRLEASRPVPDVECILPRSRDE